MGEARRRKAEIEKLKARVGNWYGGLHGPDKAVADVAIAAFKKIVVEHDLTGGCYNLAFFLREYLKRQHGIEVEMVVGWVTDDSWDGGISHAWIEHNGRKTDISLWNTEHPEAQIPGAVLIHDFDYQVGETVYTYHRELPPSAKDYLAAAAENEEFGAMYRHKDAEHAWVQGLAANPEGATEYFSKAPPEMKYEALARMLAV